MTTDDRPLNQKDPSWIDILNVFRKNMYEQSLHDAIQYEKKVLEEKNKCFQHNAREWANVYYTITSSAYGLLEKQKEWNPTVRDQFFHYLDRYVCVCRDAADTNTLQGMHTNQPKTLLGNALELLCKESPSDLSEKFGSGSTHLPKFMHPAGGRVSPFRFYWKRYLMSAGILNGPHGWPIPGIWLRSFCHLPNPRPTF